MMDFAGNTSVLCHCPTLEGKAQALAEQLGVAVNAKAVGAYAVVFDAHGVYLQPSGQKHGRVMVDFCGGSAAHRRLYGGGKSQMIAKAVGIGKKFRPQVFDATAGLGKDAFVLASLGCEVTLMERSPVAHALLDDGLRRALTYALEHDAQLLDVVRRMVLHLGDSAEFLRNQAAPVADVVYVDPMFPDRQKQAAVKKDMQAFHAVIGKDLDAETLLQAAMGGAVYRCVVKRSRLAPVIAGAEPAYALQGKSSRYDIYTIKGVPKD